MTEQRIRLNINKVLRNTRQFECINEILRLFYVPFAQSNMIKS